MKKKRFYLLIILIILILISAIISLSVFSKYRNYSEEKTKDRILSNYNKHYNMLVLYTDRINSNEDGIKDELLNLLEKETDPLYIGTYKNALSYYYLKSNDYGKHKEIARESILEYKKVPDSSPLILEAYSYIIKNSIYQKDYNSSLIYCYESLDELTTMDYRFISETFAEKVELIINCNLINIFVNNDLSSSAEKYYDKIKEIKKSDPLYNQNSTIIVFSKLIYNDSIGNYSEALELAYEYHELGKSVNSPNLEGLRINLATVLIKNDMADEAFPHIVAAENHYLKKQKSSALGNVYTTYGHYYMKTNNYKLAYDNYLKSYTYYKDDINFLNDQKTAIVNMRNANSQGNLNIDISYYLEQYLLLNIEDSKITNLFTSMNDINIKNYETKLYLLKNEQISLIISSKEKQLLILLLSSILLLFIITTIKLIKEIRAKKLYENKLLNLVNKDFLTGCYTRSYGIKKLNDLIANNSNFSIALIDIDNFKNINDTYGHSVGDDALRMLGKQLTDAFNNYGCAIRYGGEEFLVILKNKNLDESLIILDNFRENISNLTFCDSLHLTISIGLKSIENEDLETLINLTDSLLYNAKNTGKNKVCT